MKTYKVIMETIDHKKKKYKCCKCGKEATVKTSMYIKWLGLNDKDETVEYYCDECLYNEVKEALNEVE